MSLKRILRLSLVLVFLHGIIGNLNADTTITPFTVNYVMSRDGSSVAETEMKLVNIGGNTWKFSTESKLTSMLALLFSGTVSEESEFVWNKNNIQVKNYIYIKGEKNKSLEFSNNGDSVIYTKNNNTRTLKNLPAGTLDSNVVNLALFIALKNNEKSITIPVTDGKRIKYYQFNVVGNERITVPLGEYNTLKVERTKKGQSTNKPATIIWLSPDLSYVPIKIVKVDSDGEENVLTATHFSR